MWKVRMAGEKITILSVILAFVSLVDGQCGYQMASRPLPCGGYQNPYAQHLAHVQPLPQPLPQPVLQPQSIDYYYRANAYTQPPAEVLSSVAKEITTAPVSPKSSEYEDIDKKIGEFKTTLSEETNSAVESPTAAPASTYIRETAVYQPYIPHQLAYRPQTQPLPQAVGCGVMVPQYYRPAPYMPRGYMLPYTPMPTYAPPPPPPQPLPTYIQSQQYRAPVNDCCGRCSSVCGHGVRRIFAKSAKTVRLNRSDTKFANGNAELKDPRCTSEELKDVMMKISHKTPTIAKRLIQRIAEEKFGGFFSVICSKDDFTYVSRGEIYCQTENNGVVCYAFKHR